MVSCRVVIIPAHQVLSPCVANLPSLSRPREAEGDDSAVPYKRDKITRFATNSNSVSEERLQSRQFKFAPLKMNMMMLLSAGAGMTPGMMYGSHNPRWWSWWRPLAPAQSSHLSHYGDSGAMMAWWPRLGAKWEAFYMYNQHTVQSTKGPLTFYWWWNDIFNNEKWSPESLWADGCWFHLPLKVWELYSQSPPQQRSRQSALRNLISEFIMFSLSLIGSS